MQKLVLTALLAVIFSGCRTQPSPSPGVGSTQIKVAFVRGDARTRTSAGELRIKAGQVIKPGEAIVTGSDGLVDFHFGGSYAVRVKSNTVLELRIAAVGAPPVLAMETEMTLSRGNIIGDVINQNSPNASRFEIRFSTGALGIRGISENLFSLSSDGDCTVQNGKAIEIFVKGGTGPPAATLQEWQTLKPPTAIERFVLIRTPIEIAQKLDKDGKELRKHCFFAMK